MTRETYYPETIEETPLPETLVWESIANRPRSLEELDPETQRAIDEAFASIDAEFLTLGDLAYLDSITTTQISDSAITTPKLAAGAVVASKISVGSLSAISADLGTITAGTIIGALIRTSSTGSRVEIVGTNDEINIYDSGNDLRMKLDSDELGFYNTNGVRIGYIETPSTTNFRIATPTGNAMILDAEGTNILDGIFFLANGSQKAVVTTDGFTFNDRVSCVDRVAPATDNTEDLGSPSLLWDDIYVNEVNYNTLTSLSDRRSKENIQPLQSGLQAVLKLKPVSFNYKKKVNPIKGNKKKKAEVEQKLNRKASLTHFGFIAQEVRDVLPEIYEQKSEDAMATIRQTEVTAVLVKAVQELYEEVQAINAQLQ